MASVFGPRGVQFQGRENDPQGVLRDILKSMEGLDPATQRLLLNAAGLDEQLALMVGHEDEISSQTTAQITSFDTLGKQFSAVVKLGGDFLNLIIDVGAAMAPIINFLSSMLDDLVKLILYLEQGTPQWIKNLVGASVVLGGIALIMEKIAGLAVLAGLGLPGKIGIGVGLGALGLYELLKPKDKSSGSSTTTGDLNQTNNYNIQSNDPNSITQRIQELHEQQRRDTQYQSPLTSY